MDIWVPRARQSIESQQPCWSHVLRSALVLFAVTAATTDVPNASAELIYRLPVNECDCGFDCEWREINAGTGSEGVYIAQQCNGNGGILYHGQYIRLIDLHGDVDEFLVNPAPFGFLTTFGLLCVATGKWSFDATGSMYVTVSRAWYWQGPAHEQTMATLRFWWFGLADNF
jgi:hypothetical protein